MLTHRAVHKKGPDSHIHTVLCETTQPPYWDPFHLSLLTTVVSCGLIGPHQTASLTSSVITRNPPSLAHCLLSLSHSIPTHQHHTHVCLSLAFISPAYWTPPLASEWSFDGAAPQHKSIFAPFTYYHANKWFVMSVLGAYNGRYRLCTLQALLMGPYVSPVHFRDHKSSVSLWTCPQVRAKNIIIYLSFQHWLNKVSKREWDICTDQREGILRKYLSM